jgi:hypothetical protein
VDPTQVSLSWSRDPGSYAGGSVGTRSVSHAGLVKGDDPGKKRYYGPPGWGLGVEGEVGIALSLIKSLNC